MASKNIITSWFPDFDTDGDFTKSTGWEVVLRHIFTVLVTRPGTRQWNPEFGCKLLDMLFEVNLTEQDFKSVISDAINRWIPYVRLEECECKISPMTNHTGNKANIKLKINYNGETKNVLFDIPPQLNLMDGNIHSIKVTRK